jgi:hypothetical protein
VTDLTFVPLPAIAGGASVVRSGAAAEAAIVFGREAVFVDIGGAALAALAQPLASRWELRRGQILAAVVQKGRLFQRAYPDVPVLRDRGRFLLVELDPGHPALTAPPVEPCFAAYRVGPGDEVFRDLGPAALGVRRDPAIEAVLGDLSTATFRATLEELVRLRNRLSTGGLFRDAVGTCRARLDAMGYPTMLQEFDMPGGRSCNLLALPDAAAGPAAVLVLGHLDSVNHAEGPEGMAPGADDNGSGSAGVIAMAEALVALKDRLPVGFALLGGEEQGLHGSQHLLATLSGDARAALRAVINMDMIGTLNRQPDGSAVPGVLLEGAEVSRGVVEALAQQAASWTDLTVQTSFHPFASDHVPFIQAGLPAVLTIEGADQANDQIHGAGDTLDRIDDELAHRILRMNTAYVASLASAG